MTRYFHLLSNGKTVKEIDHKQYRKLAWRNFAEDKKRLLCVLHNDEIYFYKHHGITIRLKQLNEVLGVD